MKAAKAFVEGYACEVAETFPSFLIGYVTIPKGHRISGSIVSARSVSEARRAVSKLTQEIELWEDNESGTKIGFFPRETNVKAAWAEVLACARQLKEME